MRRPPLLDDPVRRAPARKQKAKYCGGKPPLLHEYGWVLDNGAYMHDVWVERCVRCGRKDRVCYGNERWFPWRFPKCVCGHHKEEK